MCAADNSTTCPESAPSPPADDRHPVLNQQVRHRRDVGEIRDIRQGQGFGVSRLAAISGNAAFLAPPIGITPSSGTPPLMRILSIASVARGPPPTPAAAAAYLSAVTPPSRLLLLDERSAAQAGGSPSPPSSFLDSGAARALLGPGLLLAPPQIVAQRLGQTLLALCAFSVVFCAGLQGCAIPRCNGTASVMSSSSYSSIRIFACVARITATACFAAYSAD